MDSKEHKVEGTQVERVMWNNPSPIAEWIVWIEVATITGAVPIPQ